MRPTPRRRQRRVRRHLSQVVALVAAVTLTPPVVPMLAVAVPVMPGRDGRDRNLRWEPKFDGWRCLAFRRANDVYLQSRAGRPLSGYFPDIAAAVAATVPPGVVLDGELVIWHQDRTSFALLQARVTAGGRLPSEVRAHPAHYVVFDVLQNASGQELLTQPLRERRQILVDLLTHAGPQVALCPQTRVLDEAVGWLTNWTAAGVEGVVAKPANSRYHPGQRRGWQKFRVRCTTEAIIGGVTGTLTRPETLLVGRYDLAGRLRYTGRSFPLSTPLQQQIAPELTPTAGTAWAGANHPWPQPLPAAWSGQLPRPEPVPYLQVVPSVVVEISVDTAFEHLRWRHGLRVLRTRADLTDQDVPLLDAG